MTQGDVLLSDLIETAFLGARQHFYSTQLLIYIRHLCKVRHIGLEQHKFKLQRDTLTLHSVCEMLWFIALKYI